MTAGSYKDYPSTDAFYVRAVSLSTLTREWQAWLPGLAVWCIMRRDGWSLPRQLIARKDGKSMPADPANVAPPEHPLPRPAAFELTRYRRELERALKRLPADSGARPGLLGQSVKPQTPDGARLPRGCGKPVA